MELEKGKVLSWNKQNNSLQVIDANNRRIEIFQDEFSIYDSISPGGLPFEVQWLIGKTITYAKLETGLYSRKAVMADIMSKMEIGDIFSATVVALTIRSVFMEHAGCFFHCTMKEVSKARIKSVAEYFSIGQTAFVKLLTKGQNSMYPEVSYKQAYPDSLSNYHSGDFCIAKVTNPNPERNAYFVEISPTVCGLLDFSHCPPNALPLNYGDEVFCSVKNVSLYGLRLIGLYVSRRAQ